VNDGARDKLIRMVKSHGVRIGSTPQSCEIFLKQLGADYREELEALTKALREGLVGRLLKSSQPWKEFAGELTRDLVGSGMRQEVANWVVVSWAMALGKHPSASGPAEPDRIPTEPPKDKPAAPVGRKLRHCSLLIGEQLADWSNSPGEKCPVRPCARLADWACQNGRRLVASVKTVKARWQTVVTVDLCLLT
jgi:hypothetical protein